MKQIASIFIIFGFFILMLCFPSATFSGAVNGLLLWFQSVLPSLLPFIIVSNLLIHTNAVSYVCKFIKPLIQRLFRVSDNGCFAVLTGFLCGYPMGAKVVSDLIKTNRISINEGKYLLSFCNNTSPMFILSFIVLQNLRDERFLLPTLFILFLSPILCSFLFRNYYKVQHNNYRNLREEDKCFQFDFEILDTCIMNGFDTITRIGGYIILFSILFSLCSTLPIDFLLPSLEISNGILWIARSDFTLTIMFPWMLGLTSFGGFCAVAQTKSMLNGTGISIFPYIIEKLITALVTSLLAILYIQFIHQ